MSIGKRSGVSWSTITKVSGVTKANVEKVSGVEAKLLLNEYTGYSDRDWETSATATF